MTPGRTAGTSNDWLTADESEDGFGGEGGEELEGFHAHDGVALRIEAGAPDGDGVALGTDGGDPAADTALPRETDEIGELTRFVVEPAGLHDGVHALDL